MRKQTVATISAVMFGLGLQFAVLYWLRYFCLPFEVHTFKWQCELNIPFVGGAFILPGMLYGWVTDRAPWLGGLIVAILLVLVGAATRLLSPWYGIDLIAAAIYAIFFATIPCILGSVGAFTVHRRWERVAL